MILAGDIGGTNARLAYFHPQNGNLRLVSERVFPSREHHEFGEIVTAFLKSRTRTLTQLASASRARCVTGASKPRTFPG